MRFCYATVHAFSAKNNFRYLRTIDDVFQLLNPYKNFNFFLFNRIKKALWATRETEDIDKIANPDKYVKITLRELVIYIVFLTVLTISNF